MISIHRINARHIINIGISPNEADLAIVSIDYSGTAGELNSYVLGEYGYSINNLPTASQLTHGFYALPGDDRKPIIFVVTVNEENTAGNLRRNLYNTLSEFRGWFRNKKVWIPLMGTGAGGLNLEESYSITAQTIDRFQNDNATEVEFIISLPNDYDGKQLIKAIQEGMSGPQNMEVDDLLKKLNCNYFLVGSIWGKEDQSKRFFEEEIWEKGQEDESYSAIINQIRINDILFIKSTFAQDGISYLRIKAIGLVVGNPQDGTMINVDWRIRDLWIDIEHLGYYRSTVTHIDLNDVVIIFSNIDKDLWPILLPVPLPKNDKAARIAGLLSDSDKGDDYLDIAKDVTAFARVIAAKSFEPPLAIALFGKWGSGKSFFMRKLKEQVIDFSDRNTNGIYCKGIAHIHFNAWSYMDANLWASIVSKIFEGLNEYISDNSLTEVTKKEIEKKLTNELSITKEEINILESKKESVNQQMDLLVKKKKTINKFLEDDIKRIETDSLWKVIKNIDDEFKAKDRIIQSLEDNETFIESEEELKEIIPEKYWSNPEAAYQQIRSKYTFIKEFFRRDKIQYNLICLVIILLIILLVPFLLDLLSIKISTINFLIPQAWISFFIIGGTIWRRAEVVYNKLQPMVASFWTIKEEYDKQIKEAVSKFEQEEKALNLKIQKNKAEILILDEQIQKAETIIADLDFKINHALATEALYSFIDKRSKSEDYKKHLGIISTIRKDFEILNGLFTDHHREIVKAKEAEEFKRKFSKPLERIILYIDDLDRCPEENVVQVLEAVNLLMAFPLFIVIVGVDTRWVKNALIKKHALQFTGRMNEHQHADLHVEMLEPANYLEKIFQVPFHLKDANDISVKDMIRQLAIVTPNLTQEKLDREQLISDKSNDIDQPVDSKGNVDKTTFAGNGIDISDELTIAIDEKIELLILTNEEVVLMQDMSEVIGNNPRAVKRFVNIFRIIKAHEEFSYDLESASKELPVILFLLALPLGDYRKLLPSFEGYIQNMNNTNKPITQYLQLIDGENGINVLKHQLNTILSNKQRFDIIQQTPSSAFWKHNAFIKRFTYKNF